jgi:hypothetical protein
VKETIDKTVDNKSQDLRINLNSRSKPMKPTIGWKVISKERKSILTGDVKGYGKEYPIGKMVGRSKRRLPIMAMKTRQDAVDFIKMERKKHDEQENYFTRALDEAVIVQVEMYGIKDKTEYVNDTKIFLVSTTPIVSQSYKRPWAKGTVLCEAIKCIT